MENLLIKHKTHSVFRKILGALTFFIGVFWIIIHLNSMRLFDWIYGTFFTLLGAAYIISAFGSSVSSIRLSENSITVRWINWLRSVIIPDSEIESIKLTRVYVLISRKGKKQVKLNIDFFEKDEKDKVYLFMTEYSGQKNIVLETNFNSPL